MGIISILLLAVIAVLHYAIFLVEAFLWTHRIGIHAFRLEKDFAVRTRVLALNQGLYNAFLASGIVYAIWQNSFAWAVFFAVCVFLAGIVGGFSSNKKILIVQSFPAALALTALFLQC